MARVLFAPDLPATGPRTVRVLTLGDLLDALTAAEPWLEEITVTCYVNQQDASLLEGRDTPVDEEDTVLLVPTAG
ncbi:MAG: MoaD/ThiS family protein [Candidatus Thermoplasmatota archaeon]|nr:MoaD/ThiS family protein [Candidatus Thermoplasmatota archaeon]